MARFQLHIASVILVGIAACAQAQHHHGGRHGSNFGGSSSPRYFVHTGGGYSAPDPYTPTYVSPVVGGDSYASHARDHHHHRTHAPVFYSTAPVWLASPVVMTPQPIFPVVSVTPVGTPTPIDMADDPAKLPPKPSTPAGKLKSLEHQVRGDEKLRKRLWAQAYMSYRSAIDAAGDRGEARFRQGFTYTAMRHFSSAVREFQRGLFLDATLPESGIGLSMLFGPDSETLRTSIFHKVGEWVKEDPRDPDRWFLLGLMLHYEDDPRSRDALKTAQALSDGPQDHIVSLLNAQRVKSPASLGSGGKLASLFELPAPPFAAAPNVVAGTKPNIDPELPPLLDQAIPPVIRAPGRL